MTTKTQIKAALRALPVRENGYNGDPQEIAGRMVYCRIVSGRRYYHTNKACYPLDRMAEALLEKRPGYVQA